MAIALCLGADFTMVGRAYLYGLMAGGQEGVEKLIQILAKELEVTMHLLGAADLSQLHPGLIRNVAQFTGRSAVS